MTATRRHTTTAIRSGITTVLATALGAAILPGAVHADDTRDELWALDTLNIAEAHKESRGASVTIGMVDSGVDAEHPDLKGNIKPGLSTFDESKGLKDTLGHGTAMASDLAAHGHGKNNADGVLGIAPDAEILPVSVYPPGYKKNPDDPDINHEVQKGFEKGIQWLADQEVDVILVANVVGSTNELEDAVNYAVEENDIPLVAGAGNVEYDSKGKPKNSRIVGAPASFKSAIGIAGTTDDNKFWDGSVRGREVQFAAPAKNITSAKNGGGYETGSGTSDASAITAGVVALMKAQWPDMGWKDIHWRLSRTADDKGESGPDQKFGYGIINPVDALTAHVDPPDNIDDEQINPPVNPKASPKPSKDESKKDTTLEADTGTNTWLFIAILVAIGIVAIAVVVAILIRKRNKTSTPPTLP